MGISSPVGQTVENEIERFEMEEAVSIAKKIKCPSIFCGSIDCFPITTHQNFKIGRGIVGGIVGAAIHPVGAMVGVATGFNGKRKVKFRCNKCGRIFTKKV